ncbi:hypothetical protein CPB86DRAFT_551606 [Serendipita vermifera]|nr:hypothetical protein CPB86DRAFT_551606 [Serendipita vermifera]
MASSVKGSEVGLRNEARDSTQFPGGYGDFTFKSSDNVIFSFPRGVLSHISPAFNDIVVRVGNSDKKVSGTIPELPEDSVTITELLHHIDPLLEPLPLQDTTVVNLLKAAKRYQIPKVLQWIELEANKKRLSSLGAPDSLSASNPLLFLYLGYQLDSKDMIKEGLRGATTCHISKLQQEVLERFTVAFLRKTFANRTKMSAEINSHLLGTIVQTAQTLDLGKDFELGPVKSKRGFFSRTAIFHPKPCHDCADCLRRGIQIISALSVVQPGILVVDQEFQTLTNHPCRKCGVNIYKSIWEQTPDMAAKLRAAADPKNHSYHMTYQETVQILLEKEQQLVY